MMVFFVIVCFLIAGTNSLYTGPYVPSKFWTNDVENPNPPRLNIFQFTVALKLRNKSEMHQEFLDVSIPTNPKYGKHLTLEQIKQKYGPKEADKERVVKFFRTISEAEVKLAENGDIMTVTASVIAVEQALCTKLSYRKHSNGARAIRADTNLCIPKDIASLVSFISLNSPISHLQPRAAKSHRRRNLKAHAAQASISVTRGNEEAIVRFQPVCGNGVLNTASPPCSNVGDLMFIPDLVVSVNRLANSKTDPYSLETDPLVFNLDSSQITCLDSSTLSVPCDGSSSQCTCVAKIAPLPKYTQLQANITYTFPSTPLQVSVLGVSTLFALTDVATPALLSALYSIPDGLSARYGSNQSVVEFYGEFYSNSDLSSFLSLSGLPDASIPEENVLGDLPNNQTDPGGEAQLDVEYIMALAPGANTFFYSFSDLNPNDEDNEGFLAYLTYVNGEPNPPLVQSLSYGEQEYSVFVPGDPSAINYGNRCNEEFMKAGLRGITILFASGDDGVGSSNVECDHAVPEWPTGSPYVTAVGATQLFSEYLPACGESYAVSSRQSGVPQEDQLLFQCTGAREVVCSSSIGGVITSGGGFSDVSDRATQAPWQVNVVNKYLQSGNAPPLTFFNASGRAYPDVSTYGSNYFVFLDGSITRESGTSASTPVFAAMVTLWNDMRFAYGLPPLGFIAPFLYSIYEQNPEAFQDITSGNNACGAGSSISTVECCDTSFEAVPGWDPVSGLGSPNFKVISSLVLNSNIAFPTVSASKQVIEPDAVTTTTTTASSLAKGSSVIGLVFGVLGFFSGIISLGLAIYS